MSENDRLVIHSASERGFWSNGMGWVYSAADASQYTRAEIGEYNLPLSAGNDAAWVVFEYDD